MPIGKRERKFTKKPKVRKTKKGEDDLRVFEDKWGWCATTGGDNPPIKIKVKIGKIKGKVKVSVSR